MYDPMMRVFTVLEILQAREQVTGADLASRLEVSLRTVQRYIARLQDLCIPVESVRGVEGCYRLKPGFRLPPLMFTDDEAFALTLGLRALRSLGLSAFAPATEGAVAKLGRVLPEAIRESVQTVEEVIALETSPWTISTSAESVMQVAAAIRTCRQISFDYESHAGARSRRTVEPYGVLHMDGRWYMAGHCLLRQSIRTFRLDRVNNPEPNGIVFNRPASFDIQTYLQKAMPFVQSTHAIEVWLDMPHATAKTHLAAWRMVTHEENGGTVIECGRDSLKMFAAMLLSFGCRVVVREPPELREVFAELAALAVQAAQPQS